MYVLCKHTTSRQSLTAEKAWAYGIMVMRLWGTTGELRTTGGGLEAAGSIEGPA